MNNSKPDNDYSTQSDATSDCATRDKRRYNNIENEDLTWVSTQAPCVQTIALISWGLDSYGDKWIEINTTMPASTFRRARKVLKDAGLFDFRTDTASKDNRRTDRWLVRNLKGSKAHLYDVEEPPKNSKSKKIAAHTRADNPEIAAHELSLDAHLLALNAHTRADNLAENLTEQESQDSSLISNTCNYKEKEIKNKQKESSDQVASLDATQPSDNLTEEEKTVMVVTMRVIENTRIVVPVRFVDRFDKEVEAFKEFLRNQPEPVDEKGFQDLANREYDFLRGLFDQYQAGLDYSLVAV